MPTATKKAPTTCPLTPIDNRIVIKRDPEESTTKGGIVLPDTSKEKKTRGTVLAVGPGRVSNDGTRVPPQVKVGDRVLFAIYTGEVVEEDDEEFVLIPEHEILAIVR